MSAVLQDYCNIWRVTTTQRDARSNTFMAVLAGVLILGFAIVVVLDVLKHHALSIPVLLRVLTGLSGFWIGIVWATLFVPGALLLNSAANARLLPRQRRRLMQMVAGGWLLLTFLFTAASGSWKIAPVVGLFVFAFAMTAAGNRAALFAMILCGNMPWLLRVFLPSASADFLLGEASQTIMAVLMLPALAWGVLWMFPAAGDKHYDRHSAQVTRMRRYENGQGWAKESENNTRVWHALRLYGDALRRDCKTRDPGRMLMHALGPVAHWSAWIPSVAVLLVIGVGVRLALAVRNDAHLEVVVHGASVAGLGGFIIATVLGTIQVSQQMSRVRSEQALLRLTPLAGDARFLNRRLATQLLKNGMILWALLTVAILVAGALITADAGALLRHLGLCFLAGQVAMMGLLGDYASNGGWRPPTARSLLMVLLNSFSSNIGWNLSLGLRAFLLALLEGGVALGVGILSGKAMFGWLLLIAMAVAGSVFQLRRTWRIMLAAPPAFPARRFD